MPRPQFVDRRWSSVKVHLNLLAAGLVVEPLSGLMLAADI